MTIPEARRRVESIVDLQADAEAAHSKEVDLLWDFVSEVAGACIDDYFEIIRLRLIAIHMNRNLNTPGGDDDGNRNP